MEEFRIIIGYEGLYKVSNRGNVLSIKRDRLLSKSVDGDGYLKVALYKKGKRKDYNVHRLVVEAFLENPLNLPQVNHKNGNKLDADVDNLEWVTSKENVLHSYRTGLKKPTRILGEKNGRSFLKEEDIKDIRRYYKETGCSFYEIARVFGISRVHAGDIIKRKKWKHI